MQQHGIATICFSNTSGKSFWGKRDICHTNKQVTENFLNLHEAFEKHFACATAQQHAQNLMTSHSCVDSNLDVTPSCSCDEDCLGGTQRDKKHHANEGDHSFHQPEFKGTSTCLPLQHERLMQLPLRQLQSMQLKVL